MFAKFRYYTAIDKIYFNIVNVTEWNQCDDWCENIIGTYCQDWDTSIDAKINEPIEYAFNDLNDATLFWIIWG